jgi:hypothetical protein
MFDLPGLGGGMHSAGSIKLTTKPFYILLFSKERISSGAAKLFSTIFVISHFIGSLGEPANLTRIRLMWKSKNPRTLQSRI